MKIRHQCFVVLVHILLSFSMLLSQETEPVFEHVSNDLHLPNVEIRTIHQDKTGFIWFGNINGLYLYDGHKITTFTNNLNDSNSISNNSITKILETKDSTLWFGTARGLNKYNPKDGKFKRFLNNPEDSTSIYNNSINGMVEDKYGNLWIITNSSISFYDITTQKFKNYIINNENKTFSFTSKPTSIDTDLDGNLLIGYENLVLDYIFINDHTKEDALSSNVKYKRFHLNKGNNSEYAISCVYQSSDKKYWIGTEGVGFFSIDYKNLKTDLKNNTDKIE
jgi:ligand-binding sensor domain-containing protein